MVHFTVYYALSPYTVLSHRTCSYFSDASQEVFGVVTYLRVKNAAGDVTVTLVMAKGKLAPLKAVTIPHLELTEAALAVKQDSCGGS